MILDKEIKHKLESLIKIEDLNPLQQAIYKQAPELFWHLVWNPKIASYWFRPIKVQRIVKRRAILELIGTGLRIKDIAKMLDVSPEFIRNFIKEQRKNKQKEKTFEF